MLYVITGGSGSGKSRYAEQQILDLGPARRIYIATMHPYDEESFARIDRHRAMRAEKQFETLECYTDLKNLEIPSGANVLLECMSNLTANEMYEPGAAGEDTVEEILEGIRSVQKQAANLVIVTNEIFSDGIEYDPETVRYQQYLGQINQTLAAMADMVTEVVYGIPLMIKRTM
ncbi:MAG: bifunctional adenosylcobinamide kinase/adenosylcobinamide-phosphate guanylyltransferase [Lachnospiraceae bacterium]|nr:bifunctional adenosylcobinamide kinase/adenosylcobinamide-phosphate guanylyltransferase [Lachnospiraceae bacterium]